MQKSRDGNEGHHFSVLLSVQLTSLNLDNNSARPESHLSEGKSEVLETEAIELFSASERDRNTNQDPSVHITPGASRGRGD